MGMDLLFNKGFGDLLTWENAVFWLNQALWNWIMNCFFPCEKVLFKASVYLKGEGLSIVVPLAPLSI